MFITVITITLILILIEFKVNEYRKISKNIEIYVPISCEMYHKDTHNGFNMDGEFYSEVYFNNRQAKIFLEKIKENENWKELPMSFELQEEIIVDKFGDHMEVQLWKTVIGFY